VANSCKFGNAPANADLRRTGRKDVSAQSSSQGVLDKILGRIAFYCIDESLPPLTSIVVGKRRGVPGADIPMDLSQRDSERERVYTTEWFNVYPPTAQELDAALERHK